MRLERFLLRELIVNFLFAMIVIYSIATIGTVIQLFTHREVPLLISLTFAPMALLSRSELLTPFAFLVAVLFTYGRISAENEYLATQACGIHPFRILAPVLLTGLLLSALQSYLLAFVVPNLWIARDRIFDDLASQSIMNLDSGRNEIDIPEIRLYLSWQRREGAVLEDVYIDFRGGSKGEGAASKSGETASKPGDVTIETGDPASATNPVHDKSNDDKSVLQGFAERLEIVNEPLTYRLVFTGFHAGEKRSFGQASFSILLEKLALRNKSNFRDRREFMTSDELVGIARRADRRLTLLSKNSKDPAEKKRYEYDFKESRVNWYEFERRIAWSFASLLFGMIGAPIAIWLKRGTRLFAIVAALGIVFILYFPLTKAGDALIQKQHIPVALCAWPASALLAILSCAFFYRLVRR
ncbi:MAG: LptF/LptG family permease [Planctomycetota bacterium]